MRSLLLLVVVAAAASMAAGILLPPEVTNQLRQNVRNNINQMMGFNKRQTIIPVPIQVPTQQQYVEYVIVDQPVYEYVIIENMQQFEQYYPWYTNQIPNQEYIVVENGQQYLVRPGVGVQYLGPVGPQQQEYIVVENGQQYLVRPGVGVQYLGPVGVQFRQFQLPQQYENVPFYGVRSLEGGKTQILGMTEPMAQELVKRNEIIRSNNKQTVVVEQPKPAQPKPQARAVAVKMVRR